MSRTSQRPRSAAILLYRRTGDVPEVLLVHPGGPFWRNRWRGWWQLPKGMIEPGEEALAAARREFAEELGSPCAGAASPLGEVTQAAGKRVVAFAVEGDLDPSTIAGAQFTVEWPPRSGVSASFPEVDAARWFSLEEAADEMLPSQRPFLDRLLPLLAS
ncbi:NUDIX domain-containing protein [Sphingomonas sp. IC4-52]|uniref:NUDIX domain-containing protein n=1 Tax=Sphingomonas sp. IC4-52 TaxID=2887202 RepID=UPI001D12BB3F|nr:NUDIX domain-containing protein [Sphingomonas sp. IC4-52]MCC2978518.1 NUDIX domain-containing protein [Sphingomonas sp. IC4-52]